MILDDPPETIPSGQSPLRYDWSAFGEGMLGAFSLAGLVMACSFVGFGAFIRSLDFELVSGLLTVVLVWALPGQVVFVSSWTAGAGLFVIGLAVTLTAIRLLPIAMLVLSVSRVEGERRWPEFLLAHFIAVTMWMIANRRLHAIPLPRRLPWLLGVGATLMAGMLLLTSLGFFLAERLPATLAATLVFFTPSFFLLSLFGGARLRLDYLAIGFGALIGAVAAIHAPKLDLLLGGLLGGTLAYVLGRPRRRWLW